jgi:putative mRNA 3-end processing factor
MARLGSWIEPHPEGIYVRPADAWVDPSQPKARALVTHGHADHARGGHGTVWATPETLAIMGVRYGDQNGCEVAYGESVTVGEVEVSFVPAGHVLGSAQIILDWGGERVVVSGDYKRRPDPTCEPFLPVRATSSSPRRPSACRCSTIPRPAARSTGCSPGWPTIPTAACWSAPMRWARRSG